MNGRSLLACGMMLAALPAMAATIYSGLEDLAIPTGFTGIYLDIDTGATSSSAFSGWDVNPFFGGAGIGNSAAFQPARVAAGHLDAVLNLAPGTVVSSSLVFASGTGGSGNPGHAHLGPAANQFQPGSEGYLGFRFAPNGSAAVLNGWMRLTLTSNVGGALIRDWAYDDAGGAIVIGRVQQSVPLAGAQTVTLSPETGEDFSLGSAITDAGGDVNRLLKTGEGRTTLATANSFTGTTTISAGTLEVAGMDVLGETSGVIIESGGTLLLSGSGDRVNDAAGLTLAGGTLRTGGLSETVGALTLLASSTIDFGASASPNSLRFAPSADAWTGTLSIWNWTTGTDRLFFGASALGLSSSQLASIRFYSDAGFTELYSSFSPTITSFGEVVPVPEPGAALSAVALLGVGFLREHRRVRRPGRRSADGLVRCGVSGRGRPRSTG